MVRALNTAASGMNAQQTLIDIIANNLANVNTSGFKKSRGEFQDLYYQQIRAATETSVGSGRPIGLEVGQGVKVMASQKLFTQGEMQVTAGAYDVGIEGDGFLKFSTKDRGYLYSRAGELRVNEEGYLVNLEGDMLDPPVRIPDNVQQTVITREGVVSCKVNGTEELESAGEIKLTTFPNPAGLSSLGGGLYSATAASGVPTEGTAGTNGVGGLRQGSIESSNVTVVEEMIGLISAQRAYEINSKVVQATDQMLREASNIR